MKGTSSSFYLNVGKLVVIVAIIIATLSGIGKAIFLANPNFFQNILVTVLFG
jgi:uncharacterized phage infection (PIP) family protein YhgE